MVARHFFCDAQGAAPELRVQLDDDDPLAAPQLIVPSSPAADAVLPALTSWDVAPSATDIRITLDSHMVQLAAQGSSVAVSCKLQVRSPPYQSSH